MENTKWEVTVFDEARAVATKACLTGRSYHCPCATAEETKAPGVQVTFPEKHK